MERWEKHPGVCDSPCQGMEVTEGRGGKLLGMRDCSGSAGGKLQGGTPALEGCLSTSRLQYPAASSLFVHPVPAEEPEVQEDLNFLRPLQREEKVSGEYPSWIWPPSHFPPPSPIPSFPSAGCEMQQTLSRAHYSGPIALNGAERSCS